jgi:hypothetical protein
LEGALFDSSTRDSGPQCRASGNRGEEGPPALARLEQDHLQVGAGRGQDQTGEAGSRPEIEHPGRRLRQPGERGKGLGEVSLDDLPRGARADQVDDWRPPAQLLEVDPEGLDCAPRQIEAWEGGQEPPFEVVTQERGNLHTANPTCRRFHAKLDGETTAR